MSEDLKLFDRNDVKVLLVCLVVALMMTAPLLYYTCIEAMKTPELIPYSLVLSGVAVFLILRHAYREEVKFRKKYPGFY